MRKVFNHSDALEPHRSIEVSLNDQVVRVTCDAAGIAAVSHVLSWQEWEELVAAVNEDPSE